jgi:dihydroorotate dehydrogenase electron transfer subunit
MGLVTDLLAESLAKRPGTVYACGPEAMLRRVARLAREAGVRAHVSLETHMACGVGACLGCVVPVKSPTGAAYQRVCLEGPVFDAEDLAW